MKKRKITPFEIASLILTVTGFIWIGGFQYSGITRDIQYIRERLDKIDVRLDRMDARFDRMEIEFHKMDIRVNTLEHRKH